MRTLILLACLLLFARCSRAQLTTRIVKDTLHVPWELVYGPDDHIWFTMRNGYICRLDPATSQMDTIYHETNTAENGEAGMLGLALDPGFPAQPYIYAAYVNSTPKLRIVKYQYDNSSNSITSQTVLLDQINASGIHNGCRLLITNNKLFATTGDASNSANAQNLSILNGKVLRINLDGSIPTDNPIPGSPIWSWGHRNPQGLVYAHNILYSTEHGPNNDDEVNIIEKGRNYGWPTVQGFCNTQAEITFCNDSNVVEPLQAWTPTLAVCGIDFYEHAMFPQFQKSIIMTTLKDSKLYQLQLDAALTAVTSATEIQGINFGRLRDVCIAPDGRIYISTSNSSISGNIDKIIELYDPSVVSIRNPVKETDVTIYPNPANQTATLTLPKDVHDAVFEVFNSLGQMVNSGRIQTSKAIHTGDWVPGVYTVKIRTKDGTELNSKFVKE